MNTELVVIVAALAVIAAVAVWLLKKWAAKPNEWASKIPPQSPDMQTEEMKPAAEPAKPPPILPPQKPLPRQEQRRK